MVVNKAIYLGPYYVYIKTMFTITKIIDNLKNYRKKK